LYFGVSAAIFEFMRIGGRILFSLFFATANCKAGAVGPSRDVNIPITNSNLHFEFSSQDGELTYPCTQAFLPDSRDFSIHCVRAADIWDFIVHLRLFRHDREVSPKMSYELLFWVNDERLQNGNPGEYIGTTLWFRFAEPSPLLSLEAGQDIENTMVLRALVDLPPI
jgi:hypothetical protein